MTATKKVSIIIPVKNLNSNLKECLEHCLKLDYDDFEIIVLPDEDMLLDIQKVRVISTGKVTPPKKRDMALDFANGEILAFIDDDAYPKEDWLNKSVPYFDNLDTAAVCGPAVTAHGDSPKQKASGFIFSSPLVSGNFNYRYVPKISRFVQDYPSCNFLIRKSIFQELGGFKTNFWPGEDTVLCLEITRKLGKKILYDPGILVYHHRRPLFVPHLKQIANYALHRGYFAKRYPETSLKVSYFIPSVFLIGLSLGFIMSIFSPIFRPIFFTALSAYLVIALSASALNRNFKLIPLVFVGIILSHIAYGWFFLRGLLASDLKE